MVEPALEVIAYTNEPQRQLIRVDRDNFIEYHGAYTPTSGSAKDQANDIHNFLEWVGGNMPPENIVAGRVFASSEENLRELLEAQKSLFGGNIPPQTQLHTKPCEPGAKMAYQFEAIVPKDKNGFSITPVYDAFENRAGTVVEIDGRRKLYLRGILGKNADRSITPDFVEQAHRMYEQQQALLDGNGFDYTDVSRAHIFLSEMSRDYDHLNEVRNAHFTSKGIGGKQGKLPPASTGIGIKTFAMNALCISDLIAETGGQIEFFDSLLQKNTWEYTTTETGGLENPVNFSRLALSDRAYVSGHSHIIEGVSKHINDFPKALRQTFVAGESVLMPHGLTMDDALSMIVYIMNSQTHPNRYNLFLQEIGKWMRPSFSLVAVDAWICRDNLSYEHGLEALSAKSRLVKDASVKRRQPILDLNYIPPKIEPRFDQFRNKVQVIEGR